MMRTTNNIFPIIDKNKAFSKTKSQDELNFKTRFSYNEIPLTQQISSNKPVKKQLTMRDNGPNTQPMNSKNFIKDFSNKLEKHQYDIEKRDEMIRELEITIDRLRMEYINEKQSSDEKNRQIKELIESYDKLNNRFKTTHIKMEELVTKVQFYEKEFQKIKEDDHKTNEQKALEQLQTKKIEELEQKVKEFNAQKSQFSEVDKQRNSQINELTAKLTEQIQNGNKMKSELDKKDADLQKAQGIIKAFEEEKKLVENNIQNLRRQSTLKQQELEGKSREQEIIAKNLQNLKDENNKLNSQVKELKSKLEEQLQLKGQQSNEVVEMTKTNNQLKEQLGSLTNENNGFNKQIQDQKQQISSLEQQISQKNDKLQNMLKELENTRNKQTANDKSQSELNQNLTNLKKKFDETDQKLLHATGQLQNIQKQSKKLEEAEKEILKSLKCNYCEQFIKEPITIIPCGHSFCFGCKKAYAKDCIKCGPKVKVEAMYRNELLDDIIGMVKIVQGLQNSLKIQ